MEKCESCLHFNVCEADGECTEYKDKTYFVKLPCKLNDIVFVIPTESNGFESITKMECLGFQISKPCFVADLFRKENGKSSKMYQPGFDDFGKTVFFTKEEAENELSSGKK